MPVSEALRRLTENPAFWTGDGAITDEPDAGELRFSFGVTGGYALIFEVSLASGERTLGLRGPATSEPVQLAWAPAGGPFPAALRWWELDLCARVIALEDPTLPHPGLVVALLSPFRPGHRGRRRADGGRDARDRLPLAAPNGHADHPRRPRAGPAAPVHR